MSSMLWRVRELEAKLPAGFEVWEGFDLIELRHPQCGTTGVFSATTVTVELLSELAHTHSLTCDLTHGPQKRPTPTI